MDVEDLYMLPMVFRSQGIDSIVVERLGLSVPQADLAEWESVVAARKNPEGRARAIAAQLALDAPFEILPIERMEFWAPSGIVWLDALPLADALAGTGPPPPLRESLWLLRDHGFDRILLTHKREDGAPRRAFEVLVPDCGPAVRSSTASVWRVPSIVATDDEATRWRAAQADRVAAQPVPLPGDQYPGR